MSGTALNGTLFLISCFFDFYIMVLFIRALLSWSGADYHHPLTLFVVKLTSFAVKPLKKFIPDFRNIETATIVLILLVVMLKYLVLTLLSYGMPNIGGLLILAIGDTLRLLLETLSIALILQAVLSWLQPNSPVYQILTKFTLPPYASIAALYHRLAGVDITPFIAIIVLQLLVIIILIPLSAEWACYCYRILRYCK